MKINSVHFHPHKVTGKSNDSFIGLKIYGNDIRFYYPEAYRINESAVESTDVLNILRTISLAKTSSSEKTKTYSTVNIDGDFALNSYLWIISDFLSNGFYVNREKLFKVNQHGKVNWKRTLKQQPMICNGNVIYGDIVSEVKNTQDNILVEMHRFCVKTSLDFIGWLFNLDSDFIEATRFNAGIKAFYLATLQNELDATFDDEKRMRLLHMKKILSGIDDDFSGNEFVYGVDSYHYIFEKMINEIFGTEDPAEYYPKAKWKLVKNYFEETESSSLMPDTVLKSNFDGSVYIIDSKFYRFGTTQDERYDLPDTTSIQKQITYGDYVKNEKGESKIFNAFLLPYDSEDEKETEIIKYIGYAEPNWRKVRDESHGKVYAFLIDLKHVISTWNSVNHNFEQQKLIEQIHAASNSVD